MTTIRIKLTIAYDGSAYHGWQAKKDGSAVQNRIEEALARLFSGGPKVESSSRTDSGVHAWGMIAHVDVPRDETPSGVARLALAMNGLLPADIRVRSAVRVSQSFHARFGAVLKQYRYHVWNHPVMNPLRRENSWHVPRALDLAAMCEAAELLVGRQDFRAFTSNRGVILVDAVRCLTRCEIRKQGPRLRFLIEGEGFLYKQCRAMVGTLVQVGEGKFRPCDVREMLEKGDRTLAGMNAPAHGLVLWRVFYSPTGSVKECHRTGPDSA